MQKEMKKNREKVMILDEWVNNHTYIHKAVMEMEAKKWSGHAGVGNNRLLNYRTDYIFNLRTCHKVQVKTEGYTSANTGTVPIAGLILC